MKKYSLIVLSIVVAQEMYAARVSSSFNKLLGRAGSVDLASLREESKISEISGNKLKGVATAGPRQTRASHWNLSNVSPLERRGALKRPLPKKQVVQELVAKPTPPPRPALSQSDYEDVDNVRPEISVTTKVAGGEKKKPQLEHRSIIADLRPKLPPRLPKQPAQSSSGDLNTELAARLLRKRIEATNEGSFGTKQESAAPTNTQPTAPIVDVTPGVIPPASPMPGEGRIPTPPPLPTTQQLNGAGSKNTPPTPSVSSQSSGSRSPELSKQGVGNFDAAAALKMLKKVTPVVERRD